jgi:hypothetical protein
MTAVQHKPKAKPGRPPKVERVLNCADASIDTLTRIRQSIAPVLEKQEFQAFFAKLSSIGLVRLINRLADEVAFIPAAQGLVAQQSTDKPGPKPAVAHIAFHATVRDILKQYNIELCQWENGRATQTQLADFCWAISLAGGVTTAKMSSRTARALPRKGFSRG